MKIILTGSLGNISRPLTKELVQKGHAVTVISSKPERQQDIEALGAIAAIGVLQDTVFLTSAFSGADVVYCMIPPANATEPDRIAYYREIATNYAQAIQQAGVKRAIYLSSFGADLDKGTGIILGAHHAEMILNQLQDTVITHIRPTYFYNNLFMYVGMIKRLGRIAVNYGGDDKIPMVSPIDIAAAIAGEIEKPAAANQVRYVSSGEYTGNEIAGMLGAAIGKPDLKWQVITDQEMQQGLEANGLPAKLAAGYTEMFASLRNGLLSGDFHQHAPALGKVKLPDFVPAFAVLFNQN
ncbi:NAD(P)H-binding protein [Chitinophaga agrisoli]|uniref:NAD(P)H-binding protein n=1 Tax=Chitinophaga agrisoli TaxID=2607653 RepID=A0A5B2W0N2_9BACT|nr:NAD(P)H-binding protein [Chitinophaga agrisoli]KAA2243819.1 NAD(P)H-binding protein [Chitinophaga agrisoli]